MSFKKSIEMAKGRSLSDRLQMSTSPKTVANPYKKSVKKTKKSRGMRKSVTVIENGIRKARRIKKFADNYYVGLAYMGLLELDLYETRNNNGYERADGYTYDTDYKEYVYRGTANKETPVGEVRCYVGVHIGQDVYNKGRARTSDYYGYDDNGQSVVPDKETVDMWNENTEGITQVKCWGNIEYTIDDFKSNGKKTLYESELRGYTSVEDLLDAITSESEIAWGEVTIALGDFQDAMDVYNSMEEYYPETITLNTPNGEQIVLNKNREGFWEYDGNYSEPIFNEENIKIAFHIGITAVDDESRYSYESRDRNTIPLYYKVYTNGEIIDNNTQTSASRNEYRPDSWNREFTGQGAETLEGAIAIAESNIAEVYQEWQEYIASNRNYEERSNGRGYQHTTVNTKPWDYNYGDTYDDERYEEWQDDPTGGEDTWDNDEGSTAFSEEYFGSSRGGLCDSEWVYNSNGSWIGYTYYSDYSYANKEKQQQFLENHTREDVERVCAMTGCTLTDYTDPLNFTITFNRRIALSVRKIRKVRKVKRI